MMSASMVILCEIVMCIILFETKGILVDASTTTPAIVGLCDVGHSVAMALKMPSPRIGHIIIAKNRTEMMILVDAGHELIVPGYKGRIKNLRHENGYVKFDLKNVSQNDSGRYACHQNAITGTVIPNCGQTLVCIDFKQTYVNASQPVIEGRNITLTCSVTSSPENPNNWHQNFHYSWFQDDTFLGNQAEREARLGPLTQADQGNYTCCPSVDVGLCLPLKNRVAFLLHLPADQNGNNPGLVIGLTVAALVLVVVVVVVSVCAWRWWKASRRNRRNADNGTQGVTKGEEFPMLDNGHQGSKANGAT